MRHIQKSTQPPPAIQDYITNQIPVGHGLDYKTFSQTPSPLGGSRGGQLCRELTAEQFGLCAYTGAGIDARLGTISDPQQKLRFQAHNEHLKPQSVCRKELIESKREPGVDLGDDMDHRNIVAALEVRGASKGVKSTDLFGATYREDNPISLLPVDHRCEREFVFDADGNIFANNSYGQETIKQLQLDHATLRGWRRQAITVFIEAIRSKEDAIEIIQRTTSPTSGILPEYSFAIRSVISNLLEIGNLQAAAVSPPNAPPPT